MKLRKTFVIVLNICILTLLTGCKTITIMELKHNDTECFFKDYDIMAQNLNNYKIGNILLVPYTSYNDELNYTSYEFNIAVFKKASDGSIVTIDKVTILKDESIVFQDISREINKKLIFGEMDEKRSLVYDDQLLIESINDYDMKVNKKSKLKVVIEVSVEKNNVVSRHKNEYLLEASELVFNDNYFTRH